MKISIITVSLNAVDKIEATIRSVLDQSYPDIEYLVFDGGSGDGTVDILRKYEPRIAYWQSAPDDGLYDALNQGVRKATGDWIGILNCGDVFSSDRAVADLFSKPVPPGIGVVYGNCYETDRQRRVFVDAEEPVKGSNRPPNYRHGASFVRSALHRQYLFDVQQRQKYGYALDYLQIYTMFRQGVQFEKRPVTVIDYERDGLSDHGLKNKYYRALIANDGRWDLNFWRLFAGGVLRGIYHKMVRA